MSVKTTGNITYNNKSYNLWQRERAIAHQAHVKNVIAATSADLTLTAADTGALITMDSSGGSSCEVTLPALEAGLNFHIVLKDVTAANKVIAPVAKIQGVIFTNGSGADDAVDCANETSINFSASCLVGDWLKLECDGTNWYVSGASQAVPAQVTAA